MRKDLRVNVPFLKQFNTIGTNNVFVGSGVLYCLVLNCTNAGTTWGLTIQDRSSPTPFIIPVVTPLVVSTTPLVVLNLTQPIPIIGGLDFVMTGTAGNLFVWGNYSKN